MRAIGIMRGALTAIMLFLLFLNVCSSAYITPHYKEYTTGGVFEGKDWNSFSCGKNSRLEGKFLKLSTTIFSGRERLTFQIDVPDGLRPVTVYADRNFAKQLYPLEGGDNVIVYGKTISITSRSRLDRGFSRTELAVEPHKIEQ